MPPILFGTGEHRSNTVLRMLHFNSEIDNRHPNGFFRTDCLFFSPLAELRCIRKVTL
jgi:hypothetical protein